jgi:hypothetical protein
MFLKLWITRILDWINLHNPRNQRLEDFHKTCSFTFCGRMRRCEYESHTCGDAGTHSEAL